MEENHEKKKAKNWENVNENTPSFPNKHELKLKRRNRTEKNRKIINFTTKYTKKSYWKLKQKRNQEKQNIKLNFKYTWIDVKRKHGGKNTQE